MKVVIDMRATAYYVHRHGQKDRLGGFFFGQLAMIPRRYSDMATTVHGKQTRD